MGIKYIITIDIELLAFAKEEAGRKQISVSDLINQRDFKCEIWKGGKPNETNDN